MAHKYDNKYASPAVGGPITSVNRTGSTWSGKTDITSQASNITAIAATTVDATDLILLGTRQFAPSSETLTFHGFVVKSINPGVGFTIGPVMSLAGLTSSYQVSWMVVKA